MAEVDRDPHQQPWLAHAQCVGETHVFFAPEHEGSRQRERRERRAKTLCGRCSVRDDCLAYAVSNDEPEGIWGGMTTTERRYGQAVERAKAREHNQPTVAPAAAVYKRPQWRDVEERFSLHGSRVLLQHARQNGADQYRILVDDEIIYRTDYEPEAWIFLHSSTID